MRSAQSVTSSSLSKALQLVQALAAAKAECLGAEGSLWRCRYTSLDVQCCESLNICLTGGSS